MAEEHPSATDAFGAYIRSQRRLARMTLRELAERTSISNPYLSQIERGLHQPSVKIISALAKALDLSVETLLARAAGLTGEDDDGDGGDGAGSRTEQAIRADAKLSDAQKAALLAVYRDFTDPGRS